MFHQVKELLNKYYGLIWATAGGVHYPIFTRILTLANSSALTYKVSLTSSVEGLTISFNGTPTVLIGVDGQVTSLVQS